jgi:type II secretory pathway pseudopilin PulG
MKVKRKQFGSIRQIRCYITAFTLVEVLIVVALIVVLVSMVLVATSKSWVDKEGQLTKATIALLDTALQEYHDYKGFFPNPNSLPEAVFGNDYVLRHNASLYAQLNFVPDSRKVLGRLPDSQIQIINSDYLIILDAWGKAFDYLYVNNGDTVFDPGENTFPVIISAGPDKKFGSVDDITNKK